MILTEKMGLPIYINPYSISTISPSLYRKGLKNYQCTQLVLTNGFILKVKEDYEVVLHKLYKNIDFAVEKSHLDFKDFV